jgi:hypothetical protein
MNVVLIEMERLAMFNLVARYLVVQRLIAIVDYEAANQPRVCVRWLC